MNVELKMKFDDQLTWVSACSNAFLAHNPSSMSSLPNSSAGLFKTSWNEKTIRDLGLRGLNFSIFALTVPRTEA
jgi:hypothetical protein